jgi:hypothetical protein
MFLLTSRTDVSAWSMTLGSELFEVLADLLHVGGELLLEVEHLFLALDAIARHLRVLGRELRLVRDVLGLLLGLRDLLLARCSSCSFCCCAWLMPSDGPMASSASSMAFRP